MSNFFLEHPVFAWVIAILIMLFGALSIFRLPVELYPSVAPPTITVSASYPGASAKTMEDSVTQVIEQQLTGIDHLRYFTSASTDGMATVTLTFEPEADPDIAQVQTQNKVQAAVPQLPTQVQQQGVAVRKANSAFLLVASFSSEDGSINQVQLGDLVSSQVKEAVARVNGVGDVQVFGSPYSMRIWLNPNKLYSYKLIPGDVRNAIQAQNTDVSAGQLGGLPAVVGQQLTATLSAQSRLRTKDQFERIVLRVNPDGSQVRLRDVARVELGAQSYERIVRYERKPAAGIAVTLSPGANALATADAVKARIDSLKQYLPDKLVVIYPNDSTPFVEHSINSVVTTLFEAAVLVLLVMFLFLQNLRATLIPAIAVPVVLLGTLGVLFAFGFTINVLTMFAIVLTIGLLVDDAIVVVENVERLIVEENLSPKEATRKSMDQISSALVGIAVVLSAVFIPMAFFSGSAGVIYRQFSLTMVTAITLSVFVALVLSPVLCSSILRPARSGDHQHTRGFFGWFNRRFDRLRDFHQKTSGLMANRIVRSIGIYVVLVGGLALILMDLPSAFLPNEDQGTVFIMVNAPPGATAGRTLETIKQVEDHLLKAEAENVEHVMTLTGFNPSGLAQNAGFGFIRLKDWSERPDQEQSVMAIANRLNGYFHSLKDATAFSFFPPPIQELGNSAGFDFQLVDQTGAGHDALMHARGELLGMATQSPMMVGVRPNGFDDVAQYKLDIDSEKASALGLNLADINQTLQTAWGSSYVNDFIDQGRIKRVYMQGDARFRMSPEDVGDWYVRNNKGDMIPFSEFATARWVYGSPKLERFNGNSAISIQGAPAPGVSSGEAMAELERMVASLPGDFALEWSGISFEERLSGSQAPLLYCLSIVVVFLSLAALYESWTVPLTVILVVPLGVMGTTVATWFTGLNNDVYFQVALLTAIGLTAKNAILIVEFAKSLYDSGHDLLDATLTATKQRFRPIVMTSMAFMLGVLPMAIASGAGSASQNAIGIGVMSGMFTATFLATFFLPMFYICVERLMRPRQKGAEG